MTTRLQVLMDDDKRHEIREVARRQRVTVAEWVRQALRFALRQAPHASVPQKMGAVRQAFGYQLPTADIEEMLAQVRSGYAAEHEA